MIKKRENLFICITLLQLKIVKKIIEKKGLSKENCYCFYYSNKLSLSDKYYLKLLKQKCSNIIQLRNIYKFPKYFFLLKNIFKQYQFEDVYVSNIDGIYVQYILSIVNPKNIFTFDDGAGNLFKNSKYNLGHDFSFFKRIIYNIFGNKYSSKKIALQRKNHYTIFKSYKNYSSKKLNYIELFSLKKKKYLNNLKFECNVILGTVEKEYFDDEHSEKNFKDNFMNFLQKLNGNNYFIRHPRDNSKFNKFEIKNLKVVKSKKIAEDFILENLIQKYKHINIYSLPVSTAQINLEKFKQIKNFILITNNLPQRGIDGIHTLKSYKKIRI